MNTQHLQYIIEIERTRSISQAAIVGMPAWSNARSIMPTPEKSET